MGYLLVSEYESCLVSALHVITTEMSQTDEAVTPAEGIQQHLKQMKPKKA